MSSLQQGIELVFVGPRYILPIRYLESKPPESGRSDEYQ